MTFRVLLSAYACRPGVGSEPGIGWNWAVQLAAAGAHVWVLTQEGNKEAIESALGASEEGRLHFIYVKEQTLLRTLERLPWRHFLKPIAWQENAYKVARELYPTLKFDIAHHVTFGSLQTGSHLWRLNCPLVFGPVGGGQTAPNGYRRHFHGGWMLECIRTIVGGRLYPYILNARSTVSGAALVLVANRETEAAVRHLGAKEMRYMQAVGLGADQIVPRSPASRAYRGPLRILWVGRLLPRKGLLLALEALALVRRDSPWTLTIIGDGQQSRMLSVWLKALGLENRVEWRGKIPWADVQTSYENSDLFLFTSLRDTTGIQLVEAMGRGVPVLTLDHHGAATLVPDSAGVKVPVSSARETAKGLAVAVEKLEANRELLDIMSSAAIEVARTHTWQQKARDALAMYRNVIEKRN